MGTREPRKPAGSGGTQGATRGATRSLLLGFLLLIAGCGRPPGAPAADTPEAPDSNAASSAAAPSDESSPPNDADLVSAVTPPGTSGANQSVSVKFRLEGRPMIGMPVKILVALIPTTDGDVGHVHGSFTAGDGLALQSPQSFDIADLHGSSKYQEVTVLPQQTGVLNLTITLLLQTDSTTQTRTYSIPLIAADNSGS
jgi:hypothetical protein